MANRNLFSFDLNRTASQAQAAAQDASGQIEYMKRDIERLLMITEALWMLLQRSHGYNDDDLRNLISEIDLRDGQLDGRVRTQDRALCPSCNRPVSARHHTCIYCGQALLHDPFAR